MFAALIDGHDDADGRFRMSLDGGRHHRRLIAARRAGWSVRPGLSALPRRYRGKSALEDTDGESMSSQTPIQHAATPRLSRKSRAALQPKLLSGSGWCSDICLLSAGGGLRCLRPFRRHRTGRGSRAGDRGTGRSRPRHKPNVVELHLGVTSVHVSIRTLLIVGGAIAAIRLILLVPASSLAARISADAQAMIRERLVQAFLRASWAVKSADREGRFQELMTNQVSSATAVSYRRLTS